MTGKKNSIRPRDFIGGSMVLSTDVRVDGARGAWLLCGGDGCSSEFVWRLGDLRAYLRADRAVRCAGCRRERRAANDARAAERAGRAVAAREHADAVRESREWARALSAARRAVLAVLAVAPGDYEIASLEIVRRKDGG